MSQYRHALPQLTGSPFLTDGGIETTLIFHEGLELPHFAAFHLLRSPAGEAALYKYYRTYAEIAQRFDAGLILESPTWRANADWGTRLGYTSEALADANRNAIHLLENVRNEYATDRNQVVISGCIGPRGDGYVPDSVMSAQEAEAYHREQVDTFTGTAADMVCAITINYAEEAVGIARAAQQANMPVALSFTVETDGRLRLASP
jgi:S-methylmethionine-dependent homocysteine/selenocysteine methylase